MPLIRAEKRTQCRCSRRNCRARRTLAKHPDAYVRPPRCNVGSCDGFMRPDKFRIKTKRLNQQHKDNGKTCKCNGYHFPHVVGSQHCIHFEDVVIDRALRGTRISDISETDNDGVPF